MTVVLNKKKKWSHFPNHILNISTYVICGKSKSKSDCPCTAHEKTKTNVIVLSTIIVNTQADLY